MPARQRAAQRHRLGDGEDRRMGGCVGDAERVEPGEQRLRASAAGRRHRCNDAGRPPAGKPLRDDLATRRGRLSYAPAPAIMRGLGRGRSSGVEHNLAKVGVEGSNPFARSNKSKG